MKDEQLISIPDRKKAEAKRLKDKRMRTRTAEERLADAAKTSYTKCPPRVVRHYLDNNVQNIYESQVSKIVHSSNVFVF
jgi:hypothetical protein